MSKVVVGLDIGTDNVRAVIAEVDSDEKVKVIGIAEKPSQGMRNGVIVNVDAAVAVIKDTIEEAELSCGTAVTSVYTIIGGAQVESINSKGGVGVDPKSGSNRPMAIREETRQRAIESARAVKFSPDKRLIHIIPQEYIVDGSNDFKKEELIGSYGVRLEVCCHLVTASITAYDKIVQSIYRAGYNVAADNHGVMLKTLAASYSTIHNEEMELGSILIDLGAGTTDVMVINKGAPVYTASIPYGQNSVTSDIAKVKGIPYETAEKIKVERGSAWPQDNEEDTVIIPPVGGKPPEEIEQRELCAIILAREEEIMKLVKKSVVQNANIKKINGSIVLTGGGAELPGIIELTQAVWKTSSVRLGVSADFGGEDDSYRSPSFATAMGLVLANKGSSSTNKTGKKNRPAEDSAERGKNKKFFKNFLKQFF